MVAVAEVCPFSHPDRLQEVAINPILLQVSAKRAPSSPHVDIQTVHVHTGSFNHQTYLILGQYKEHMHYRMKQSGNHGSYI